MRKRQKAILANIFLLAATIAIILIAGECITRFTEERTMYDKTVTLQAALPEFHRMSDIPGLGYELTPGASGVIGDPATFGPGQKSQLNFNITVNSRGQRGGEYAIPKPAGTYRIAILGDSVTFGSGVNDSDTYSAKLEKLLNEEDSEAILAAKQEGISRFEVINAGVSGYNAMQKALILKSSVADYQPDLVIFQYFWDDFVQHSMLWDGDEGGIDEKNPGLKSMTFGETFAANMPHIMPLPRSLDKSLLRHSTFYRFVSRKTYDILSGIDPVKYYPRAYSFIGSTRSSEINQQAFEIIAGTAKERGFDIFVFEHPSLVNDFKEDEWFKQEIAGKGVLDTFDLYTPLKAAAGDMESLRFTDPPGYVDPIHPSPKGHALMAQALYDHIVDKYLK